MRSMHRSHMFCCSDAQGRRHRTGRRSNFGRLFVLVLCIPVSCLLGRCLPVVPVIFLSLSPPSFSFTSHRICIMTLHSSLAWRREPLGISTSVANQYGRYQAAATRFAQGARSRINTFLRVGRREWRVMIYRSVQAKWSNFFAEAEGNIQAKMKYLEKIGALFLVGIIELRTILASP